MNNNVDQRVVEMKFDNAEFERNVKTSMTSIEQLKQSLNFSGLGNGIVFVVNKISALEQIAIGALRNIGAEIRQNIKNLANSLTVAPIKEGFSEYELKMGSVQTIMAGSGASLDVVMQKLNELNTYADKTIYSFSDMTTNIGKFTNAGVDLDTAVGAIQGVANVAAISGANAAEASRAMYNFAQALSSGYVKLIDWKSIENANMATVEFKNQLLEAAVAAGTVEKTSDGMYRVLGTNAQGSTMKETISATKNFNDSLAYQWMTTEVLTSTLAKYSDETTEIGRKAYAAAQDVKTFTQLIDTLKEAVGSGWAETWENVFGNFEEAKKLWTGVSKAIGGIIDRQSKARNDLLSTWKNAGGRDDLVVGLSNIFNQFIGMAKAVRKVFTDMFPPLTANKLWELTHKFREFTETLYLVNAQAFAIRSKLGENIVRTFKGIFAVVGLVKDVFVALLKPIFKLIPAVGSLTGGIFGVTAKIGDMLVAFREAVNSSGFLEDITNRLSGAFKALSEFVSNMVEIFRGVSYWKGGGGLAGIIESIFDSVNNVLRAGFDIFSALAGKDFSKARDNVILSIQTLRDFVIGNLGPAGEMIKKAVEWIKSSFSGLTASLGSVDLGVSVDKASNAMKRLADGMSGATSKISSIKDFFEKIKPAFKGVAKFFGMIFYGIASVIAGVGDMIGRFLKEASVLDVVNLIHGISAAFVNFKLGTFLKSISMFSEKTSSFVEALRDLTTGLEKTSEKLGNRVLKFAISMAILAGAVYLISRIDIPAMITAGTAIASLMLILREVTKDMGGTVYGKDQKLDKGLTQILAFSAAVLILAKALKKISSIDPTQMLASVLAVGSLMAMLYLVVDNMKDSPSVSSSLAGLISMAAACLVLSMAIKKISNLGWDQIAKGLVVVGALILGLTLSMKTLAEAQSGENGASLGDVAYLMTFANAIKKLVSVMADIAKMPWSDIGKGLAGITILLIELTASMKIMASATSGAKGMVVSAVALLLLVGVIKMMANMEWETIGKGLLAIAATFVTLGISAALLTPVIGTIVLLGQTLWKVGVGFLAIAAAMAVLAIAAPIFVASAALIAKGIELLVIQLAAALPRIIAAIAESIIQSATDIVNMIASLIGIICSAIRSKVSDIVDTVFYVLMAVLDALAANAEQLYEDLMQILVFGFLEALGNKIVEVIPIFGNILKSLVDALVESVYALGQGDMLQALAAVSILEKIIWKLGVIVGLTWLASGVLPAVGGKLSEFASKALVFFNALRIVSPAHLVASKSLAEMLVIMTSAGVRDALTSWFTGRDRLTELGQQLADFAPYFATYARNVHGIDANKVIESSDALEAITKVKIPKVKPENYTLFGEAIRDFGTPVRQYSDAVTGFNKDDVVDSAIGLSAIFDELVSISEIDKDAVVAFGESLAGLAPNLVVYGDVVHDLDHASIIASLITLREIAAVAKLIPDQMPGPSVDKSLSTFGKSLVDFSLSLYSYAWNIKQIDNFKMISESMAVAMEIVGFANEIPAQSMKTFGKSLVSFGNSLIKYNKKVTGVDFSGIGVSVDAGELVVELAKKISGGNDSYMFSRIGEFASGIEAFGSAMAAYADSVLGVNFSGVALSKEPADILISIAEELPRVGGIVGDIIGDRESWTDFYFGLSGFASGLVGYAQEVLGADFSGVEASKTAALLIIDIAKKIPNEGGLAGLLAGNNNMDDFGAGLRQFGRALWYYGWWVDQIDDFDKIDRSTKSAEAIVDFAKKIPNEGGLVMLFTGDNSIRMFGSNLQVFGKGMKAYGDAVEGLQNYAIQTSMKTADMIVAFADSIPNQNGLWSKFVGDNTMKDFGTSLAAFGEGLRSYGDTVDGLKNYAIRVSMETAMQIVDFSQKFNDLDLSSMDVDLEGFGFDLESFGTSVSEFSDRISMVDTTKFGRISAALNILTTIKTGELAPILTQMNSLLDAVYSIDAYTSEGGAAQLAIALKDLAENGIGGLSDALSDPEKIREAISAFVDTATSVISDKTEDFRSAASDLAKSFITKFRVELRIGGKNIGSSIELIVSIMRSYRSQFYSAGLYLVEGYANGISDYTWKAVSAGRKMAKETLDAINEEQDSNSPSKKAKTAGSFLGEGYIIGIKAWMLKARYTGRDLASETLNATNEVISRVAEYISDGVDTQPTIRPVLDLTNVANGFGQLNAMLSQRHAVSIGARMNEYRDTSAVEDSGVSDAGPTYNYIQNNYSPKALNTAEVYRLTNNQLSRLKGRGVRR